MTSIVFLVISSPYCSRSRNFDGFGEKIGTGCRIEAGGEKKKQELHRVYIESDAWFGLVRVVNIGRNYQASSLLPVSNNSKSHDGKRVSGIVSVFSWSLERVRC